MHKRFPPSVAQHVTSACVHCKRAHLACDEARPCKRCVRAGRSETCVDSQHKKRGRPRLVDRPQHPSTEGAEGVATAGSFPPHGDRTGSSKSTGSSSSGSSREPSSRQRPDRSYDGTGATSKSSAEGTAAVLAAATAMTRLPWSFQSQPNHSPSTSSFPRLQPQQQHFRHYDHIHNHYSLNHNHNQLNHNHPARAPPGPAPDAQPFRKRSTPGGGSTLTGTVPSGSALFKTSRHASDESGPSNTSSSPRSTTARPPTPATRNQGTNSTTSTTTATTSTRTTSSIATAMQALDDRPFMLSDAMATSLDLPARATTDSHVVADKVNTWLPTISVVFEVGVQDLDLRAASPEQWAVFGPIPRVFAHGNGYGNGYGSAQGEASSTIPVTLYHLAHEQDRPQLFRLHSQLARLVSQCVSEPVGEHLALGAVQPLCWDSLHLRAVDGTFPRFTVEFYQSPNLPFSPQLRQHPPQQLSVRCVVMPQSTQRQRVPDVAQNSEHLLQYI